MGVAVPKLDFITFLSDFGHGDDFVGTCHGVIKQIAPATQIIDLTHEVRRHDILQGAIILANTLPYMPESIILAVVDPGVGGGRQPLALRTTEGRYLVGPDNGLLSLAAEKLGGAAEAVELACSTYSLQDVCKTFEGRDLFSPAAAHLSLGVELSELGAPVEIGELTRIELPDAETAHGEIAAPVVYIDRFGNVEVHLSRMELESMGATLGSRVDVRHGTEQWSVPFVETFAEVAPEELLVYEDSYRKISFSINQGDAARTFQINVGDRLLFRIPEKG
jgi:S-adenosylmethionine hydrolase